MSKTRTWKLGPSLKSLGGPNTVSRCMLERCMNRMRSWVALCVSIVNVKFPSFEVLYAFQVFDLSSRLDVNGRVQPRPSNNKVATDVARLCRFFNVDQSRFLAEFEDYVPSVVQQFTSRGAHSWMHAWAEAVRHVKRRADVERWGEGKKQEAARKSTGKSQNGQQSSEGPAS